MSDENSEETKKVYPVEKCNQCGKDFPKKRPWQEFCNSKCRWKSWNERHPRVKPDEGKGDDDLFS